MDDERQHQVRLKKKAFYGLCIVYCLKSIKGDKMGHKGTQVPRFKPFTQFWLVFIYLFLSEASTAIVISVFNLFKRNTKILNMSVKYQHIY